jgi:hypothetical protein
MEVKAVRVELSEALPYLQKASEHDTSGGLLTIDDICHGAVFLAIECDGERVGAYALKLVRHTNGAVLWVQSCAANLPGADLTPSIVSIIEQQARQLGAHQIAFATVRRGLVKKMQRLGFGEQSVILRKNIK